MVLMLLVVACYTVCGLSDKYSVAKLKFDGNSFTFLMALPTAILLLPLMPFSDMHLQLCWQSALAAVLIMVSKLLEFKMSALVLTEMSAFELKAWLGLCLFASYATDIITAVDTFSPLRLLAIAVTAIGLFMKKPRWSFIRSVMMRFGSILQAASLWIRQALTAFRKRVLCL